MLFLYTPYQEQVSLGFRLRTVGFSFHLNTGILNPKPGWCNTAKSPRPRIRLQLRCFTSAAVAKSVALKAFLSKGPRTGITGGY